MIYARYFQVGDFSAKLTTVYYFFFSTCNVDLFSPAVFLVLISYFLFLISYSYFLFFHSRKMKKWRHVKFDVVVTLFRCLKHVNLVDFIMGNKIHNDVIVSFYHSCFLLKWFLDNIYYLKFSLLKLFKLGTNMELNQILDQHIMLK